VSNLNLFSKVTVNQDGGMQFHPDNSVAGDTVDLRFEMDALVVLSTCQHPLDPDATYRPRDVALSAWQSGVAGSDDACRQHCAENQRAFINTERFYVCRSRG
jgi:uncharacterized protein YcgI (DUF1989 family)